ncbi:protein phosphatase 4, regulatory subunit 2 [Microbotryomycetes sp. JL201]|nr:protein phosphatase 4, regulatory subunit 2 [Microbotryomycetes sp. JL201]
MNDVQLNGSGAAAVGRFPYDELLEQIATTNLVDADWPILRDMIKVKMTENIRDYLALGPPWPLEPDEAWRTRDGANDVLDSFSGPPFTIQRLCELALKPRQHYTSLSKYMRALNRVLSVSSERSAFNEDDSSEPFASTSAVMLDNSSATTASSVIQSPMIATRRPAASPNGGPSHSSPSVVPLLSPIPWLSRQGNDAEDTPMTPLHLNGVDDDATGSTSGGETSWAPLSTGSDTAPDRTGLPQSADTHTPTGGLVDEVDPGSGGAEVIEPVELSTAGMREGNIGSPGAESASLRERFVRASSPKTERPLDPEATQAAN